VLQLRNVHDGYPHFEKRATCAFLAAFVCDVHLKDRERATRAYENVIVLHPKTLEAQLAQQSLAAMNLN
jgi:TolA-binding protein